MKRLFVFCFSILVSVSMWAQEAGILISVRDSVSTDYLPDANLTIVSGPDTIRCSTNTFGNYLLLALSVQFDSVQIQASHLGYVAKTMVSHIDRTSQTHLDICLCEDPLMISEIIISANYAAMVMRGDTTVFNASAFKTMEGDALRDLLTRLPGVLVSDSGISYNGQTIDRIVFNGNNLFGNDLKNAMDMVLAKEVKSIEVYKKNAPYAASDSNDDMENIMDVHTWHPLEHVGELQLVGDLGSRPDDFLHSEELIIGDFSLKSKPRISTRIYNTHNPKDDIYETDAFGLDIGIGKDVVGKHGYDSKLSFGTNSTKRSSESSKYYSHGDCWDTRRDSTYFCRKDNSNTLNWILSGYYGKGTSHIRATSSVNLILAENYTNDFSYSMQDGVKSGYDRNCIDSTFKVNYVFDASYKKKFTKKGRTLTITPHLDLKHNIGNSCRSDTSPNSIQPEYLTGILNSSLFSPKLTLNWQEPLTKKTLLLIQNGIDYTNEQRGDYFTNQITGETDLHNTKDYGNQRIRNTFSGGIRYGKRQDGLFIETKAGIRYVNIEISERAGDLPDWGKQYMLPIYGLTLSYSKGALLGSLEYREWENSPTSSQLRKSINNENPLFIYCGNPDLAMPVGRSFNLHGSKSIVSRNTNVSVDISGIFTTNEIVSKTTHYSSNAYIPELDVVIPAGSSFIVPTNTNGGYDLSVKLSLDRYFVTSKIDLSSYISFTEHCAPLFINENCIYNRNTYMVPHLGLRKSNSDNLLIMNMTCPIGSESLVNSNRHNYINPTLSFEYRGIFCQHLEVEIVNKDSFMFSELKDLNYTNYTIDGCVSYVFNAYGRCKIGVFCSNLTDSRKHLIKKITEDYLSSTVDNTLERAFGLSFKYTFSSR